MKHLFIEHNLAKMCFCLVQPRENTALNVSNYVESKHNGQCLCLVQYFSFKNCFETTALKTWITRTNKNRSHSRPIHIHSAVHCRSKCPMALIGLAKRPYWQVFFVVVAFLRPKYLFMQTYSLKFILIYLHSASQKQMKKRYTLVSLSLCHARHSYISSSLT